MDVQIDVQCSETMLRKFCLAHGLEYKLGQCDRILSCFFSKLEKKNLEGIDGKTIDMQKSITIDKVKVGDYVKITYCPYSQKYIEHYEQFVVAGMVFFIDIDSDNLFLVRKVGDKYIVQSLEREYCSYFGDTRGYCYFIYKF